MALNDSIAAVTGQPGGYWATIVALVFSRLAEDVYIRVGSPVSSNQARWRQQAPLQVALGSLQR